MARNRGLIIRLQSIKERFSGLYPITGSDIRILRTTLDEVIKIIGRPEITTDDLVRIYKTELEAKIAILYLDPPNQQERMQYERYSAMLELLNNIIKHSQQLRENPDVEFHSDTE